MVRSFTVSREPKSIPVGGEMFAAMPVISAISLGGLLDKLVEIQSVADGLGETGTTHVESMKRITKLVDEAFSLVLLPESAQRLRDRLYDQVNPVDVSREAIPAIAELVTEYTGRPTSPSPSSTSTSTTGDGLFSTDGAPAADSTPSTLTGAASAI